MTAAVAFPVQVLRQHLTALEAAITVCLADPGPRPVHRLRTETRRVEALLLLLALVPGLPEHRKQAATLQRALTKLRRAGGEVRDFDVHRDMLEEFALAEDGVAHHKENDDGTAASGSKPRRARASRTKASSATEDAGGEAKTATLLSAAASDLRHSLGRERDKAADELRHILEARQIKTARASERLMEVLEPASLLPLPADELIRDAEALLARSGLLQAEQVPNLKEDDLHTIRKAAKAARYVTESLPEDPATVEAAKAFEALQDAGGQWHDALEITTAARRYFGKGHELTAAYRTRRDRNLTTYREALAARLAPLPAVPPSKPKAAGKRHSAGKERAGGPMSKASPRAPRPKKPSADLTGTQTPGSGPV